MRSLGIVLDEVLVEYSLHLHEGLKPSASAFHAEMLVEQSAVQALDNPIIRHDDFGAPVSAAFFGKRVMVSPSGTRGRRERNWWGQAADKPWAESPISFRLPQ